MGTPFETPSFPPFKRLAYNRYQSSLLHDFRQTLVLHSLQNESLLSISPPVSLSSVFFLLPPPLSLSLSLFVLFYVFVSMASNPSPLLSFSIIFAFFTACSFINFPCQNYLLHENLMFTGCQHSDYNPSHSHTNSRFQPNQPRV